MAKPAAIDVESAEILERMRAVAGAANFSELAKQLNVKPQALAQAKDRKALSLPLLMAGAKLGEGCTLDYLVYGAEESKQGHISIQRIGGGVCKFPEELLRRGIDIDTLSAYVYRDYLYIIDTADQKLKTGIFAFAGDPDFPAIFSCKKSRDGQIVIDEKLKNDDELADFLVDYNIVGRVIWQGSAV